MAREKLKQKRERLGDDFPAEYFGEDCRDKDIDERFLLVVKPVFSVDGSSVVGVETLYDGGDDIAA